MGIFEMGWEKPSPIQVCLSFYHMYKVMSCVLHTFLFDLWQWCNFSLGYTYLYTLFSEIFKVGLQNYVLLPMNLSVDIS